LIRYLFFLFIISLPLVCNAINEAKGLPSQETIEEKNKAPKTENENGKFIIIPLPFYGTITGFGLAIKALHTSLPYLPPYMHQIYFDSISVGTTEKQFVTLNSIGQKSITNFPKLFWAWISAELM